MTLALEDLDPAATLAAATAGVRARRAAEVEEMRLAAHWAMLHGQPRHDRDPMTAPGGEGSPAVREYALPELALARETHTATTRALVADTLDLQHRLPATWRTVTALDCEPWLARKVASLSRTVPAATVAIVDHAVAAAITGHAPSTVLQIAQAKVIEADPETHAMRREADRHRRYVSLSRCDEFGYRQLIARVTAGDAAWLDAMVDRVADILSADHGHGHTHDELRSLALGWLARPADLLKLLLDHTHPTEQPDQSEQPAWAPDHLTRTVERLAAMSVRQLAALRGKGTVFVHLTETALRHQAGIARVEGHGPILVQSLSELLGHADVTLHPVHDLTGQIRVDRYEHPSPLKDHIWLLTGGDTFPFSPRTATRDQVDFDHADPYRPHGPPGQTGTHNSSPLRRRHHRWKTHGGYRCRQAGPGRHLWQTPHGLCYLVDHTGTHRLEPDRAEILLTAPAGPRPLLRRPAVQRTPVSRAALSQQTARNQSSPRSSRSSASSWWLVGVGDVREVAAEVDLAREAEVAQPRQQVVGVRRAHLGEEVGERHGGVEADVLVALGEVEELRVLRGAGVGDHQRQPRVAGQQVGHRLRAGERASPPGRCRRGGRRGAGVGQQSPRLVEQRVADVERPDLHVHLPHLDAGGQPGGDVRRDVGLGEEGRRSAAPRAPGRRSRRSSR